MDCERKATSSVADGKDEDQDLKCSQHEADLIFKLRKSRSENEELKECNKALALEVQALKEKLADREQRMLKLDEKGHSRGPNFMFDKTSGPKSSPLFICYCDLELRYVWFTDFFEGFSSQEVLGKRDEELFPSSMEGLEKLMKLKKDALINGKPQVGEIGICASASKHATWVIAAIPCFKEDRLLTGILTIFIDVTEKLELGEHVQKICAGRIPSEIAQEAELRRAVHLTEETIRAKNMFLTIMSHEIRTPLNGLLGMAEALSVTDLNKEQKDLVNAMLSSGVIIADVLGDILDLASMESGAMQCKEQPFKPSDIVQDILKLAVAAIHDKDIKINADIRAEVPTMVIGDTLRISHVLKYLVLNAIKFTPKGHIKIGVDIRPAKNAEGFNFEERIPNRRGVKSELLLLCCEISDTGIGIPEEAFATLFEKFSQENIAFAGNYGGTGLGLAICKQLAELMGGELMAHSEVGKGSIFTFTVLCKHFVDQKKEENFIPEQKPLKENIAPTSMFQQLQSVSIPASEIQSIKPKKVPRILLAEDNKVNVVVAISMLKRLGFTAQVVANGIEALEAVRKEKYDLVLLDICMPLMDGLQVAYAIRKYEATGKWPEGDIWGAIGNNPESENTSTFCSSKNKKLDESFEGLETSEGIRAFQRLPIVAVTANALRSDVDRCYAHGMDAFISKPVMFQKLRETLEKYLPIPSMHPER